MKYPAFLLTALLFLSCINVNKREYPSADVDVEREDAHTEMLADTAKNKTFSEEEQAKETPSPASASEKGSTTSSSATNKKSSSAPSSRSSSSSRYSDNMRGFDPASEDDMDDNGMSRYMENDDDEGWD